MPIKSTMSDRNFPFRFLSRSVCAGLMSRERGTPVRHHVHQLRCQTLSPPRTDSAASNSGQPRCLPGRYDRPRPPPDFFFDNFGDPHWDISVQPDTNGITRVPGSRGSGSGPRSLRSWSQILGRTPPSCWYPRDSSIVRGHRSCAGTRSRGRPVAVATVRGHFLVPGRFTPAWHTGAARPYSEQSRIRVTAPRKITDPASRQRDASLRSDRHRWEILAFSRFTCKHDVCHACKIPGPTRTNRKRNLHPNYIYIIFGYYCLNV